ncbi:NAD(+) synthase [Halorubrum sp. JWXQ-INN 858]|uniref:NAD(+) synthase n=1 Tax=Halorubrum sp. JWXQ-INN 858 TaxID=2690782 RepID=UPI002AA2A0D8|nr:NAD(+) synthase [Halorubrum sp. JWXQ-INN 858]
MIDRDAADAEIDRIASFLRTTVRDANAERVVVNMSGGLDSTVTAALATEALGPERVYALILPCNKASDAHARDAEALAGALGIGHDTVHLQPLLARFGALVPDEFDLHGEPVVTGNLVARLRMSMAYLAANATTGLVLGTTNRSEHLLGYVTKHGDGAADLLPIGHLYKTEVRAVAEALDVPTFVREKPPAAGFLPGQYDRDELGASYDVVDRVLRLGVDGENAAVEGAAVDGSGTVDRSGTGIDADAIAARLDVDCEVVARLLARHRRTAHKRRRAPTPADSASPRTDPDRDGAGR